jgi:secreted Zn-dependent insulinase-like peptidase
MLQTVGPQERYGDQHSYLLSLSAPCRVFRENQIIEENNFNFQEDQEPVDYVEKLCECMQVRKPLVGMYHFN